MKAQIVPLGTAVLGIAIGFIVGYQSNGDASQQEQESKESAPSRRKDHATRASISRATESSKDAMLASFLKGTAINDLTAEDALELLKPSLSPDFWSSGDPVESARKHYEFQLLLSKLPLSVLEEVIDLSRGSSTPPFRVQQLFGAFALRDWDKALAWANKQPDSQTWTTTAIAKLALSDPVQAAELQEQLLLDGKLTMNSSWELGMNLGNAYAKQGKAAYFAYLDSLPSGNVSNVLSNSLRSLPKEDLPAFMSEIQQRVADGKIEEWAISNLMNNLASTDPVAARKWLDEMEPGAKRSSMEMNFAISLARSGKESEALDLMKTAMGDDPTKAKEFFKGNASNLIHSNPDLLEKLAESLPPGAEVTREDLQQLQGYNKTDSMIDAAKLLKSPDEQALYLEESFKNLSGRTQLNSKDFQILNHRLQSLGLTGDDAARAQKALDAARDGVLSK